MEKLLLENSPGLLKARISHIVREYVLMEEEFPIINFAKYPSSVFLIYVPLVKLTPWELTLKLMVGSFYFEDTQLSHSELTR